MPVDANFCHDCGINAWRQWDAQQGCYVHEDFYVHNELWDANCPDDEVVEVYLASGEVGRNGNFVLCIGCFEKRLGRELCAADFRTTEPDCPLRGTSIYYWRDLIQRPPSRRFLDRLNRRTDMAKPGPKPGSPGARSSGAQGGKSRPSLKQGSSKQGARHSVPKGSPRKH